jgi:hypothetical protein
VKREMGRARGAEPEVFAPTDPPLVPVKAGVGVEG